MQVQATVARNLRRLRLECGLSQEALAVDAGIDRTYVSRLEKGIENPTVAVLERLAQALDAEIVAFFAHMPEDAALPTPLKRGPRAGQKRRTGRSTAATEQRCHPGEPNKA